MGGVVARALFTLPRFNTNLVSIIITQASPHLAPVLALDPYLLGKSWSNLLSSTHSCSINRFLQFFFSLLGCCVQISTLQSDRSGLTRQTSSGMSQFCPSGVVIVTTRSAPASLPCRVLQETRTSCHWWYDLLLNKVSIQPFFSGSFWYRSHFGTI